MNIVKITKDWLTKQLNNSLEFVPMGLVDLQRYFRNYGNIEFKYEKQGEFNIAISQNYNYGSIIASAKSMEELDDKIKDAILTSFKIPSAYKEEAAITRQGEALEYAAA
ncbi:MAG: hypothetical protein P1P90_02830 [Patescibacteria group bacterium]|nr:hypothetical protein [Patescibacteria group bacterium]